MIIRIDDNGTRRASILEAALHCFANYGFKRVSMDDIAIAASLSRPALYNHFRNKTEIFRACFTQLGEQVTKDACEASSAAGSLVDGLDALLMTAFIEPHRALGQLPHGEELIGMKTDLAADLMQEWFAGVERQAVLLIEKWGVSTGGALPSAVTVARLLVNAVEGIKTRAATVDAAEADMKSMVRLFAAALGPEKHRGQT